jgi:hypothetical protein
MDRLLPRRRDHAPVSDAVIARATELVEMIEGKWMTQAIGWRRSWDPRPPRPRDGPRRGDCRRECLRCDAIERLMQALVSLGLCGRREDRSYQLTRWAACCAMAKRRRSGAGQSGAPAITGPSGEG